MTSQLAASGHAKQLIILGGGLSGLSYLHYLRNFTHYLKKSHLIGKIILLEANDYMGGSVKTKVFEDGLVHELGPRSIRRVGPKSKNTIALLDQLKLDDKIIPISKSSGARYIYDDNKMHQLRMGFGKIFQRVGSSSTRLGAAIVKERWTKAMNLDGYPDSDPPIYDFAAHRLGVDLAEKLIDPLLRGITAGDARKLSTRGLIAEMLDKEQKYGSITKAMHHPPVNAIALDDMFEEEVFNSQLVKKMEKTGLSYSLTCGLQAFTEHLSNSILNTNDDGVVSIYNQTKVESLAFNEGSDADLGSPCSVVVKTIDGDQVQLSADHVISTIPSKDFARILPDSMPSHQRQILADVERIPYSPVACVCVEYRDLESKLPEIVNSFGFLTHSKAGSKVLGISFDSSMFPKIDEPHGSTRMTCMMGGSWFKEVFGTDNVDQVTDAKMEQIALEEIRRLLKIEDDPYRMSSLLWKTGIAQYEPGHVARMARTRENLAKHSIPLTLLGQSYDGIAVNDVIFSSRMAAWNFVKSL